MYFVRKRVTLHVAQTCNVPSRKRTIKFAQTDNLHLRKSVLFQLDLRKRIPPITSHRYGITPHRSSFKRRKIRSLLMTVNSSVDSLARVDFSI